MAEPKKLTLEDVKKFELNDIKKLTDAEVEQLDGEMQAIIKEKIGMTNFRTYIMGEGRRKARVAAKALENGHVQRNAGMVQEIKAGIETEKATPAKKVEPPKVDPKGKDSKQTGAEGGSEEGGSEE